MQHSAPGSIPEKLGHLLHVQSISSHDPLGFIRTEFHGSSVIIILSGELVFSSELPWNRFVLVVSCRAIWMSFPISVWANWECAEIPNVIPSEVEGMTSHFVAAMTARSDFLRMHEPLAHQPPKRWTDELVDAFREIFSKQCKPIFEYFLQTSSKEISEIHSKFSRIR